MEFGFPHHTPQFGACHVCNSFQVAIFQKLTDENDEKIKICVQLILTKFEFYVYL